MKHRSRGKAYYKRKYKRKYKKKYRSYKSGVKALSRGASIKSHGSIDMFAKKGTSTGGVPWL